MTREEWKVQWREKRTEEKALSSFSVRIESHLCILRELYDYIYLPKQDIIIRLVTRYKTKLGDEYLKQHEQLMNKWKPEAKERSKKLFQSLIYGKNPFLSMIPSDKSFVGKYIPVPVKYDK